MMFQDGVSLGFVMIMIVTIIIGALVISFFFGGKLIWKFFARNLFRSTTSPRGSWNPSNFPEPAPAETGKIGLAVVIANEYEGKSRLVGTAKDKELWEEAFKKLNFDVRTSQEVGLNCNREEMLRLIDLLNRIYIRERDVRTYRHIAFVFSGHGYKGGIYSHGEKPECVDLEKEVFPRIFHDKRDTFNKLIFIDACRTPTIADGKFKCWLKYLFGKGQAPLEISQAMIPKSHDGDGVYGGVGVFIAYATLRGRAATDSRDGSNFSRCVTKWLQEDETVSAAVTKATAEIEGMSTQYYTRPERINLLSGEVNLYRDALEAAKILQNLEEDLKSAQESQPSPSQLKTDEAKVKSLLDSPHIHRLREHLYDRYIKQFKVGEQGTKMEFVQLAILKGEIHVSKDQEEICDKLAFLQRLRNCGKKERQFAGYIHPLHLLDKSSDRIRVVYGQPGIGKTTLLTHVCRTLAMKEADSEYALVLYFPLRNKKVSGAKNLKDLLSCHRYTVADDDKLHLSEMEQSPILFIFDGVDEIREHLSIPDSSMIQEILAGNILPRADVIVSSRSGSLPCLQSHLHSSSFYEIHGFDEASIECYVEDFFKEKPKNAEKMMKELHSRPDILGAAHIPMNLFIYCSIYNYRGLPSTITKCHKKFICNVVKRESKKQGVPCQVDPSLSRMSPEVKCLLKSLGALAYEGMMKNPTVYIFDESHIRRAFSTLPPEMVIEESIFKGLLVQHACTVAYEEENTFNFSHTTNHEFFVAWHIHHLPKAGQMQFVKEHFSNPKFSVVVRFYSGLTGLSTPGVASFLCQSVSESAPSISSHLSPATSSSLPSWCSNDDPGLLYLFHSLYESQNSKLTQSIVKQPTEMIGFDHFLTPHDILAISYCLQKCAYLKHLSFSRFPFTLPSSCLPNIITIVKANPGLLSLELPVEHLSSADATALISGMNTVRGELYLGVRETTLSAVAAIFDSKTINLLTLNIASLSQDCHDIVREKRDLTHSVSENTTLRKLVLHGPSDYMTAVLHGVAASAKPSIEDLRVQGLDPPDGGEHDVAEALAKCLANTKLREFQMEDLPPLTVLKTSAAREVPLEKLKIFSSPWSTDTEFQEGYLEEMERCAAQIRVAKFDFDLRNNTKMCDALSSGLGKNEYIQELTLGHVPKEKKQFVQSKLSSVKVIVY